MLVPDVCVICGVEGEGIWCDPCWTERKASVLATDAKRVPKVRKDINKKVRASLGPASLKGKGVK